ncbi:MAG: GC-type dockerin domain-anchored protein [Planctomycetota bacterium]
MGDYGSNNFTLVYRWTADAGLEELGGIPGFTHTLARAVSSDGSVMVGVALREPDERQFVPFRWTEEDGFQTLDLPDGVDDRAINVSGLNGDGSVILANAFQFDTMKWVNLRWLESEQRYSPYGTGAFSLTQPGDDAYIYTVSDEGVYAGSLSRRGFFSIAWTDELGVVDLHDYLRARGVDASDWHIERITPDGSTLVASITMTPTRAALITNFSLPANCLPDIDLNETLDAFDFLAFLDRFAEGDLRADLDGDGELTGADLVAFQAAFDAGC